MLSTRIRQLSGATVLIAMATSQACYAYKPLATGTTPVAGQRVRVVLTPEGTTELARFLGPSVAVAEGDLTSIDTDGSLVVAVSFVQQLSGVRQPWTGEGLVGIPTAYQSQVQGRTFMRGQTILATTALAVTLVTIAVVALQQGSGGGNGGPPPPPPP